MPCCCSRLQREGHPPSHVPCTASLWLLHDSQEAADPAFHERMPQPEGRSTLQLHTKHLTVMVQSIICRRSLPMHFSAPPEQDDHKADEGSASQQSMAHALQKDCLPALP